MQLALLIFAFLTIAGTFSAWRRSPLYSLKATIQLVCAFLLIAAVVVGAMLAILNGAAGLGPVAQGIAGFLLMLLLICGSSILVVRVTDAHVAQLPASVKLTTFNRHKVYRWMWRLTVFVLINTAAAMLLPTSWKWLPMALGGFVLLVCGPLLAISFMMARRNDRGLSAVMANPWAHWRYSPAKWAEWAQSQQKWEEDQETPWSWKGASLFTLFCAGLFALGTLFTGESLRENVIITGALTSLICLLVLVAYWFKRTNFRRRYLRLLAAAPEAWFGDEGVFCNGTYLPWKLSGRYLLKAMTASDPDPRITLIFQSFNGSSSTLVTQRIPIPSENFSDLPVLQQKLHAHCATASIHLIQP